METSYAYHKKLDGIAGLTGRNSTLFILSLIDNFKMSSAPDGTFSKFENNVWLVKENVNLQSIPYCSNQELQ